MISATEQIKLGFSSYGKAFKVIVSNKMGKLFIIPLILNIILVFLIWHYSGNLSDWLNTKITETGAISTNWAGFVGGATTVLTKLICFVIFIFLGGSIVIMCMSPIYSTLSEKTDTFLTGRQFDFSAKQTMKDIWRGVLIALKNTIKQTFFIALCFIASFIPVIGVIMPFIIFLINSYYFGFSFMDYTNERLRRDRKESARIISKYRWLAIANGAVYTLTLYIMCGTFIAVFTGGISTVAATIAQLEAEKIDNSTGTNINQ
ncbi:MAG: EI24 domain-containing protein [Bacteroidales bacterium]|nr:EI24 domain-containing protein [Bacteroidales bacterium]